MLLAIDVITQEERGLHLRFGGGGDGGAGAFGGGGEAPSLAGLDAEPERFSSDSAWMPRLVLIAKSTHVWLDQLSRRHGTRDPDARRDPRRGARPARAAGASPGCG